MFRHVLVPLDGSSLAESVLPAASWIAVKLGASVTLVHVVETDPPRVIHGEAHLAGEAEARAYLVRVAERAFPRSLAVECHVHSETVASVTDGIAGHVDELGSDLIVMCSHGHGGPKQWLFGTIAQQIVELGKAPVLLIQPGAYDAAASFVCRRILIPLDGSSEHEQGLRTAAQLAPKLGASLHLLLVVPTFGSLSGQWLAVSRYLPGTTSRLLDMAVPDAEVYLSNHVAELDRLGIPATSGVLRGDPAELINRLVAEENIDLLVLGTHGRAGADAFWSGSMGSRICKNCRVPLLLVPVKPKSESQAGSGAGAALSA
jgi:nucleotide-binding universal stress UspA family protein